MLRYNRQAMHGTVPLHGKSLLLGLVLVSALGAWVEKSLPVVETRIADIAVEYEKPLFLDATFTSKKGAFLLELSVKSGSGVAVSLPADWERTQVKNAPLASITPEDAAFGFRRWHIPQDATLTYQFREALDGIRVLNPQRKPVNVRYRSINLDTGTVTDVSRLFSEAEATLP